MAKVQILEGLMVEYDMYLTCIQEISMCTQFMYNYASLTLILDVQMKKKWDN